MYGVGWITAALIIRPSHPSLAGVGAGAELGNRDILKSKFVLRFFEQYKCRRSYVTVTDKL